MQEFDAQKFIHNKGFYKCPQTTLEASRARYFVFYAPWCGYCTSFFKQMHASRSEEELSQFMVFNVDAFDHPRLQQRGITLQSCTKGQRTVPTVLARGAGGAWDVVKDYRSLITRPL